ncbi:MAG: hypothetical protein H7330_05440, partial [Hymenobacteraceae bacterium]|nr:hypothetical protein [Hymenobacteraceae bacterium]
MKKSHLPQRLLLLFLLLPFVTGHAAAQTPSWGGAVVQPGGGSLESHIVADAGGNVYVTGYTQSPIMLGTLSLTTPGRYLAKRTSAGVWEWVRGGFDANLADVAVDGNGNVYLGGVMYASTLTFGTITLNGAGGDPFVAKISPAGGWEWATRAVSGGTVENVKLAVDAVGSAVITGQMAYYVPSIAFGAYTVASTSGGDNFVAKLTAAGAWQWAYSAGGSTNTNSRSGVNDVAMDASGNVLLTGAFNGSWVMFGATSFNSTQSGTSDLFVAKINAAGAWQWAQRSGGNASERGYSLGADASGNVYVAGTWENSAATFGAITLPANTPTDYASVLIGKLNAGGLWQWVATMGGTDYDVPADLLVDGTGNATVAGYFLSPAITCGTATVANNGISNDGFVAQVSAAGAWQWAVGAGDIGEDKINGLTRDGSGRLYATGSFGSSAITFGPTILTNPGTEACFLAWLQGVPNPPTTTGASRCGTGTVVLTAAGAPTGGSYAWYTVATGGTAISGATAATYTTPSLTGTTTYYVAAPAGAAGSGLQSATRTAVTATINPLPAAPTGTGAARCGTGTVTLAASAAPAGATYAWYAGATGGTALASTASYTTPSRTATTTYYVVSVNGLGCESSPRTAVAATINAAPAVPTAAASPTSITLSGSSTLSVTAVAGMTYTWTGSGLSATTGTSVTATPTVTGTATYTVKATNTATGCVGTTRSISLTVAAAVVPAFGAATNVAAQPGATVLVPLKVSGFNGLLGLEGSITFDTAQVTYAGVTGVAAALSAGFSAAQPRPGVVTVFWSAATGV